MICILTVWLIGILFVTISGIDSGYPESAQFISIRNPLKLVIRVIY